MNYKEKKQEEIEEIKKDIRNIINTSESTLSCHDEEPDYIYFSTRENGDNGEEHHSDIDYNDAYNIQKKIEAKYRGKVSVEIETVDEFVHLNVEFY